jgi:hypothetical protein
MRRGERCKGDRGESLHGRRMLPRLAGSALHPIPMRRRSLFGHGGHDVTVKGRRDRRHARASDWNAGQRDVRGARLLGITATG